MAKPLVQATGRRKSSVARVRLYPGSGEMKLNGRALDDYFPHAALRQRVLEPFRTVEVEGQYDVVAQLHGGGTTGQSDALRLGIARALVEVDSEFRSALKKGGMLTRDARRVRSTVCVKPVARRSSPSARRWQASTAYLAPMGFGAGPTPISQ